MIAVLGPPGYTRDLVALVVAQISANGSADGAPRTRPRIAAAVLVEPAAHDWDAARELGVPLVLVVAEPVDDIAVVAAVRAGAEAVVCPDDDAETLLAVVEAVIGGQTVLTGRQARMLAEQSRAHAGGIDAVQLTPRELEILRSIAAGETVKQTARSLGIATKTVENLQRRMFKKLGSRNRAHALVTADAMGLLDEAASNLE